MQEYTDFVDQFYLAISDEKDIVNAALSTKLDSWGLLTVSKDGQIKVLQTADKKRPQVIFHLRSFLNIM